VTRLISDMAKKPFSKISTARTVTSIEPPPLGE
jgi:hypothetical protein